MLSYERIIALAVSTPWVVMPEKLAVIQAFLSRKAKGETISADEIQAAKDSKRNKSKTPPGSVAMLGIYGTLTQRADMMSDWSGGTSTEAVGMQLDEAMADPNITAVILDVDSPGGSVYGVSELGDKIAAASKSKKITAVVNSLAASGAYWLASQASEIVASPGSQVGSIGVYVLHMDLSESMKQAGQVATFVSAGERKTAGNSYGPLDELGRAELQSSVNDYYGQFVKAVARGRNVSQATVREGFGRGGMVRAEQAIRDGMADKIGTLESVLAKYGLSSADLLADAKGVSPEIEIRRRKMLLT